MGIFRHQKTVIVQITMAIELRNALKLKAEYFGFSSIQDFVRFWALAQVEGRKIDWNDEDWEPMGLALPLKEDETREQPLKPPKSMSGW